MTVRKYGYILFFILTITDCFSQESNSYQKGISAEQNLNAIANLAPYSTGGVGFDNRYQGVKGSIRLFDTLMPSFLKIKGNEYYLKLKTDIDPLNNTLLFTHPKTGRLLSIPSDIVAEVIITKGGKELIFRTSGGNNFEKDLKEQKFYQVLKDGPFEFIKMAVKTFTEADYKGAYTPDRRYDEYETKYRYYISGTDRIFHQLQLNKKSLVKLFPEKKELINSIIESGEYKNNEEMVLSVLEKF
jgi:hypothetical protein